MDKNTKLTLDELIRRKEQIIMQRKLSDSKELYVEHLGGTITITAPDEGIMSDLADMDPATANKYIVYQCVKEPCLKSKELQAVYECAEGMDIVNKLFKMGEIARIAEEIVNLAGYDKDSIEAIKN